MPGATEVEVLAAVEHAITVQGSGYKGARWVHGFCTIFSGPDLGEGWKYWRARTRAIEEGDVRDARARHRRRRLLERPHAHRRRRHREPRLQEAYDAMRAGARAAFAAAKPGVAGGAVDQVSRDTIAAAGFTQFPHHTGHGTGFRYHESRPGLVPGGTDVLSAGNVIITEPGIYSPSWEAASATRTTPS